MRSPVLPAQIGWPGAIALLALALAWPLGMVLAPRWLDQAQALRATRPPPPPPAPANAEPQWPAVDDVNDRVAALLRRAAQEGVLVGRSQQRQDDAGPVPRLLLTLSARGGYAELRAFLADALQADPGLALLRLRWRRPDAQTGSLEAELQWSLLASVASPAQPLAGAAGVVAPPRSPSP